MLEELLVFLTIMPIIGHMIKIRNFFQEVEDIFIIFVMLPTNWWNIWKNLSSMADNISKILYFILSHTIVTVPLELHP